MRYQKSLQFKPIRIEALNRYDYRVSFQQKDGVKDMIFSVSAIFQGVDTPDEFYTEMGGPTLETRPLVSCLSAFDSARVSRVERRDILLLKKDKDFFSNATKIMPYEPVSIAALGRNNYRVELLVEGIRKPFDFFVSQEFELKHSNEFEQLMDKDLALAKPLFEAIVELHKARQAEPD
ncbi:MAG: hypothetical protein KIT34_03750 [Cyanobacteria bacterium TGS_CYA1]|nr:hypothetical protein [Cyanobacteria bacterium TGS_CYA1]